MHISFFSDKQYSVDCPEAYFMSPKHVNITAKFTLQPYSKALQVTGFNAAANLCMSTAWIDLLDRVLHYLTEVRESGMPAAKETSAKAETTCFLMEKAQGVVLSRTDSKSRNYTCFFHCVYEYLFVLLHMGEESHKDQRSIYVPVHSFILWSLHWCTPPCACMHAIKVFWTQKYGLTLLFNWRFLVQRIFQNVELLL